jgi:hypothetical protein
MCFLKKLKSVCWGRWRGVICFLRFPVFRSPDFKIISCACRCHCLSLLTDTTYFSVLTFYSLAVILYYVVPTLIAIDVSVCKVSFGENRGKSVSD